MILSHFADFRRRTFKKTGEIAARVNTATDQNQRAKQRELLNSLLQGGDTLLLELTKLKVSNGQLEDALKEVNEATHRYLFWTSDVRPMTIAWPLEIAQDLRRLISLDTFSQLGKASVMMLTSKETILPLFGALILVGCSIYSRRYFTLLAGFHAHGIDMPFPPFQMRLESLNGKQTGRTLTSAGKGRQAGSL